MPIIDRIDDTKIIVVESPDGTLWRLTVDDDGVISSTEYTGGQ